MSTQRNGKNTYDRVIVADPYRSDAIGQFVRDVVHKELAFEGIDNGWPGIVFVRLQEHARLLAAAVEAVLGQPVPAVTSELGKGEREDLVERMHSRDPSLPVVVASMVWSTGINIPPLEWALWAGEGQAPIWLKQGAGRLTRLEGEKAGYVFFDWQTVGSETERYREQAARRRRHFEAGGFSMTVEEREQAPEEDGEVRLLNELLARKKPRQEDDEPPLLAPQEGGPALDHIAMPWWAFWTWGKKPLGGEDGDDPAWSWKFAGRWLIYVICIALIYHAIRWLSNPCND